MKSTGIVRNVDELGRIVIPKEMRTSLGIKNSDPIEIYVSEDKIILKKVENSCVFCGSKENLEKYKNKMICTACKEGLQ